ncbi:hypothetical protein AU375_02313 [Methylobacterium radiotolerans]|nr:hypothetical protein AU375_02313 [Methylobacterium radiotolerans]
MAMFFTADTHFGHRGIIRMCERPYADAAEMDEALIKSWNARVQPSDTVWHLGDFAMGPKRERLAAIFERLNGTKRLVKGNHDGPATLALPWAQVEKLVEISDHGVSLVLCHYSLRAWRGSFGDTIQLFGHTHGLLPGTTQSCDVGVDSWGMAPVSLAQILHRCGQEKAEPEERLRARGKSPR